LNKSHFTVRDLEGDVTCSMTRERSSAPRRITVKGSVFAGNTNTFLARSGEPRRAAAEGVVASASISFARASLVNASTTTD